MKVLVVGSGGREHALAWRISQSPGLTGLWVASGNAGTTQLATNLDISPENVEGIVEAARSFKIDLVVVGPEQPLADGLVDRLDALGLPAFGPTQAAAQLEVSKGFARQVMQEASVPGPDFRVFADQSRALDFLEKHSGPAVVKADGLAAGKGVLICQNQAEAVSAVNSCMSERVFGAAGEKVVIEELLTGPEVSVFGLTDGERLSPLVAACDYKRVGERDQGLNTGGMGSYAPPPFWNQALDDEIRNTIMQPVIDAMLRRDRPYRGVLYAGLMLTASGPKVLEFNCRFGDPETQVILPLMEGDPLTAMLACSQGTLDPSSVAWSARPHVGVVLTSGGYPAQYQTGYEISGLENSDTDTLVFHAGTHIIE
ncbi:MAG: phosphoribosylamine--glycine ligase, partial [Dehalococcoidia bacterium]